MLPMTGPVCIVLALTVSPSTGIPYIETSSRLVDESSYRHPRSRRRSRTCGSATSRQASEPPVPYCADPGYSPVAFRSGPGGTPLRATGRGYRATRSATIKGGGHRLTQHG